MGKRVIVTGVPGKRRKVRPKQGWMGITKHDVTVKGLSDEEAIYRAAWRRLASNVDPYINMENIRMRKCGVLQLEYTK